MLDSLVRADVFDVNALAIKYHSQFYALCLQALMSCYKRYIFSHSNGQEKKSNSKTRSEHNVRFKFKMLHILSE